MSMLAAMIVSTLAAIGLRGRMAEAHGDNNKVGELAIKINKWRL